jgi:hypothetical protein
MKTTEWLIPLFPALVAFAFVRFIQKLPAIPYWFWR